MIPPRTQSFSGQTPVRLEGAPTGPLAHISMWRGVRVWEHGHLCRVFNLDPQRFYFDLPSTVYGTGSSQGRHDARRRTIDGFVMMSGYDRPVAKLRVCFASEKLWDNDPLNRRDFEDLNH